MAENMEPEVDLFSLSVSYGCVVSLFPGVIADVHAQGVSKTVDVDFVIVVGVLLFLFFVLIVAILFNV